MKYLIVIDCQNDFVTGALGSKEAQAIIPGIAKLIGDLKEDDQLIFTRDTHDDNYLETLEGQKLPVKHCIKGTFGHQIVRDLLGIRDATVIDKETFGSKTLMHRLNKKLKEKDEVHIVGLDSDICVVSNALMIRMIKPNTKIVVHKDLCAGVTTENHEAAMTVIQSCQIDIVEGECMYD